MTDSATPPLPPETLRLLVFVRRFVGAAGGLEGSAVSLCRALARLGHEVHVLADQAEAEDEDGVHVHDDGLQQRAVIEGRVLPDLCIDWGFYHPAHVHRLGQGTHESFMQWNLDAYRGPARWLKKLKYLGFKHRAIVARQKALLRNPEAHFLANSTFTADMARRAGAKPDRVTVKHNGVDTERFSPENALPHRDQVRREWGVADDEVAFLFVAHNPRLKNLRLLLDVLPATRPAKTKLVVAGRRIPGHAAAPWLHYAGQTDHMERFYAAADALLHPTFFDSCANVVLEAMSCARPVVVSDTAGVDEIITPNHDGLVLAVRGTGHADNWRQAIRQLAEDPERRRELGRHARQCALKHDFPSYVQWVDQYLKTTWCAVEAERRQREADLARTAAQPDPKR